MTEEEFIGILSTHNWTASATNTVDNDAYNNHLSTAARQASKKKGSYYPSGIVHVKVALRPVINRPQYTVNSVTVPASKIHTFKLEFSGDDFSAAKAMSEALFTVKGDRAISSPIIVAPKLILVDVVRLKWLRKDHFTMVHELLWSGEEITGPEKGAAAKFFDMQSWYCC